MRGEGATGLARLERIALREHDGSSLTKEVARAVAETFGDRAEFRASGTSLTRGIVLPVGDHGVIVLPDHPDDDVLAEAFAAQLDRLLADFAALELERVRASRLASLYEVAHELSAELDVGRILVRIVEQCRELTGADASYLSLNDTQRQETYFRATSGIRTEAFRNLRLRFGHGLGGLVASKARSYRSDDYLHDDRFVHVADPAVDAEGIASVIGVPLQVGSEVLGVLFAASRRPASFSDEHVGVCEDLAQHAAVAIANAQLHGRLRREQALHDRLTDLALEAPNLDALAAGIGDALGYAVRLDVIPSVDGDAPSAGRQIREVDGGAEVPIVAGRVRLGTLSVADITLDAERVHGLEQAARVAALHMLRERAVAQAELRSRSELLAALTDGRMPESDLVERARHFGLDLERPHRVLAVPGEVTARAWPAGVFTAGRLGSTIVLVPDGVDLPKIEGVAGLSSPATGARPLVAAIDEAARTLAVAARLGRTGVVAERELGVLSMLVDPRRSHELREQAARTLAPLLDYDRASDGHLVPTLRAFLEAQGRPGEAAKRCFVHVNTLYYRLDRIRSLTSWDLDDPDLRLHLHLACRALDLTLHDPDGPPDASG